MKLKVLLATLALSISAGAMADKTQDAIEDARKAKKAAAAVGFEWTTMGKLLKKAEKAAKDGKDKKAIKLANTVVLHSKAALKQAELAKTAEPKLK